MIVLRGVFNVYRCSLANRPLYMAGSTVPIIQYLIILLLCQTRLLRSKYVPYSTTYVLLNHSSPLLPCTVQQIDCTGIHLATFGIYWHLFVPSRSATTQHTSANNKSQTLREGDMPPSKKMMSTFSGPWDWERWNESATRTKGNESCSFATSVATSGSESKAVFEINRLGRLRHWV